MTLQTNKLLSLFKLLPSGSHDDNEDDGDDGDDDGDDKAPADYFKASS